MTFPSVQGFPGIQPNPYERQMCERIAALIRLFRGHVPDPESNAHVLELAEGHRWTAAHASSMRSGHDCPRQQSAMIGPSVRNTAAIQL